MFFPFVYIVFITFSSDHRFYIGCDFCQDWFHGTCVGLTQIEANAIEEYRCPNCCKKNAQNSIELRKLSNKELDGLRRLHRSLKVCFKVFICQIILK